MQNARLKTLFVLLLSTVFALLCAVGVMFYSNVTDGDVSVPEVSAASTTDYFYLKNTGTTKGYFYWAKAGSPTVNLWYSYNKTSWSPVASYSNMSVNGTPFEVEQSQAVYFKGNYSADSRNYITLWAVGINSFEVGGDITTLISADSAYDNECGNIETLTCSANFYDMFSDTSYGGKYLTSIDNLKLPSKTLCDYAYQRMFAMCSGLKSIPEDLFSSVETLAKGCFHSMFYGCTGLTEIPEKLLPFETLAQYCYRQMFYNCSGLTSLPAKLLPATTLASGCYCSMFGYCSKLKNAPDLPAYSLSSNCYWGMFSGCAALTSAKVNFTAWDQNQTEGMFNSDVTNLTLYCREGLDTTNRGTKMLPEGINVTVVHFDIGKNITTVPTSSSSGKYDEVVTYKDGDKTVELPAFERKDLTITYADYLAEHATVQIGTTKYLTLADAINAVANNGTITLLKDNSEMVTVSNEITFTIDSSTFTNGATISAGEGYKLETSSKDTQTTYNVFEYTPCTANDIRLAISVSSGENFSASITANVADGLKLKKIVFNNNDYTTGTVNITEKGIYTFKVFVSGNEIEMKVNLNIVNPEIEVDTDLLNARLDSTLAIVGGTTSEYKLPDDGIIVEGTAESTSLYTSASALSTVSKAITECESIKNKSGVTQLEVDEAAEDMYFAERNFVQGLKYSALSVDGNKLVVNTLDGVTLKAVTIANGIYSGQQYFARIEKSKKTEMPVGAGDALSFGDGVYTAQITIELDGYTSTWFDYLAITEETGSVYEAMAASLSAMYDGMTEPANLLEEIKKLIEELTKENPTISLGEAMKSAKSIYTQIQQALNKNKYTIEANVDENVITVSARGSASIAISYGDKYNGSKARYIGDTYIAAKTGFYTICVTFLDGASETKTVQVKSVPAPITLKSVDNEITWTVNEGYTLSKMYYVYGDQTGDEGNKKTDYLTIDLENDESVPALGKGVHTFYVTAIMRGVSVNYYLTVNATKKALFPVVLRNGGQIGVYHYDLENVTSIAYTAGEVFDRANATYVPMGNIMLSANDFTESIYTFHFEYGNGESKDIWCTL